MSIKCSFYLQPSSPMSPDFGKEDKKQKLKKKRKVPLKIKLKRNFSSEHWDRGTSSTHNSTSSYTTSLGTQPTSISQQNSGNSHLSPKRSEQFTGYTPASSKSDRVSSQVVALDENNVKMSKFNDKEKQSTKSINLQRNVEIESQFYGPHRSSQGVHSNVSTDIDYLATDLSYYDKNPPLQHSNAHSDINPIQNCGPNLDRNSVDNVSQHTYTPQASSSHSANYSRHPSESANNQVGHKNKVYSNNMSSRQHGQNIPNKLERSNESQTLDKLTNNRRDFSQVPLKYRPINYQEHQRGKTLKTNNQEIKSSAQQITEKHPKSPAYSTGVVNNSDNYLTSANSNMTNNCGFNKTNVVGSCNVTTTNVTSTDNSSAPIASGYSELLPLNTYTGGNQNISNSTNSTINFTGNNHSYSGSVQPFASSSWQHSDSLSLTTINRDDLISEIDRSVTIW